MRVGVYFGDFRPEIGGGYTYVADLLDAFAETAANSPHSFVILCSPASARVIGAKANASNVTVVPVSSPLRFVTWIAGLQYFSPLFRWVWRKPDMVERTARRYGVQILWFVGIGTNQCPDMPYIATLWDLQHRHQPFFPEVSANGQWDKREQFYGYFLRRATYCLTGTEAGKREIQDLYQLAESRVRVLPLPTPTFALEAASSTIDVQARFGLDKEYVLYPAQFWPHKNHVNLILALKWLKERYGIQIILVLTGSDQGNLAHVQRVIEQEGMTGQVRFLGFVSRDELISLYRQARALTFVSYFGPDNIPPLEAFALGCPVIASSVEGAQEQYGDAVLHVDPSNPEDIGQAIWRLHSNVQLQKTLIEAGFARAKKWTSADYIGGVLKLIDEFAAVRRNWQ